MRKNLIVLVVIVLTAGTFGCKNNKKSSMDNQASIEPAPMEPAPAPMMAPAPMDSTAPAMSGGGTYVVQRGDTLWSIAKRTYGDGQRWRDIVAANPGLVPEKMKVGQTIILP